MKALSQRDKVSVRSAGIVPVRKVGDEYLVLMLRAYSFWDFPKGRVEAGEELIDAAIRETKEEASISPNDLVFNWGKEGYTTEPFKKGTKTATYFVAQTTTEEITLPISPELGKPEHDAYEWMTFEKAKQITIERVAKVAEWAHKKITT